jgi:hypothetical protein
MRLLNSLGLFDREPPVSERRGGLHLEGRGVTETLDDAVKR